ncbi:phage major capsid protein [Sphingomonas yabuuchiae]|uniref:Phage major capsid protein n=1 Tax=Sphingomonas yabuuchiae TaxID=172044 RepID=A0AA40ZVR3_9SPHN|nr:phage major capsid protein [Sphingomonas yabuuchiae]MBB4611611.1 HK97 family phage major capsid protein [Sphingomonas yabuuchiae]MBN3556896.1 phage major capsid protein [Sphingomonas yabuuchiae]
MFMQNTVRTAGPRARGLIAVRAEAPPTIDALARGFEAFKETHTRQLEEIKKGVADVVTAEQLEKINAALTELQTAVDDQAKIQAAAKLGNGGVIGDIQADPEYTAAFKAHMRKGDKAPADIEAAMSRGTDADGGYLAPIEWDRTIGEKLKQISPMRAESRIITISVAGFKKYFGDRNVGSGWVGETASRPATTTPQIGVLDFTPGELYANPAITQQLLDDAAVDLEKWLGSEVDTEFARQEGIGFTSGDGVNKPYGVLTYVEGAANATRHPYGAIKVTNSGAAAGLTGDGILDLMYSLPSQYAANAKFHMNRLSMGAARKLKDGQGNYLWQPSYASGQPQTLAGAPIVEHPDFPLVAAGNIALLYGDMEATYLVVDRVGIRVLRDPFTNKPFVHFYTTKRVGGGVHDPQPMRALKVAANS